MGETRGLGRYEGRYQVGARWDEESALHTAFLDVRSDGDELEAEYLFVRQPKYAGSAPDQYPIEHKRSSPRRLVHASGHTFDAQGRGRSYRFVGDEGDAAHAVVVIRDGEESPPGPRFVPLPEQDPGRREAGQWMDLGHPALCMTAKDTEAVVRFYERLGFRRGEPGSFNADRVVRQGWSHIAFLDWQPQPCINYRGPSITATASELARRGYALDGPLQSTHVQGDGTGSFMVYDPDGHRMFFNTHAVERPRYEAWKRGKPLPPDETDGTQRRHELDAMEVPATLPLGQLVVCLDVKNLDASASFYQGMGFELRHRDQLSATLFSHPARGNRHTFPLRLRQAAEPNYSFGFFCDDIAGVASEIARRGIELLDTPDGPTFDDPDGNRVALLPASSFPTAAR